MKRGANQYHDPAIKNMQFFKQHFTKHTLLHSPHKWFLAFLLAPIHAAEIHYKKKYHLNFAHAKKLFIFDMAMLASILIIVGLSAFWVLYNPSIADLVLLNIKQEKRIISGGTVKYEISYHNNSGAVLISPKLSVKLPDNFLLEQAEPADIFNETISAFILPDLPPGSNGKVFINGKFFHTPHLDTELTAKLSYKQESRAEREHKETRSVITSRGSILKMEVEVPDTILARGETKIKIELKNQGDITLNDIKIPLNLNPQLSIINLARDKKNEKKDKNTWHIKSLAPKNSVQLNAILKSNFAHNTQSVNFTLTPSINVNGKRVPQETLIKKIKIANPNASLHADWDRPAAGPGETIQLKITIKNNGNIELNDINVIVPVNANIMDTALIADAAALYDGSAIIFNKNHNANLKALRPLETISLPITIPIKNEPIGGTNLSLTAAPRVTAKISGVKESKYSIVSTSPPLVIGTMLSLAGDIRYYTNEGDQLGRGPLPPKVGKTTKYWVMLRVKNMTSHVRNLLFSAELPKSAVWTGRASVSHGEAPDYDKDKRIITWKIPVLYAHDSAGINFKISITPTKAQIGTTPILVKNIYITGYDEYAGRKIKTRAKNLDISLKNDSIGRKRGAVIQE